MRMASEEVSTTKIHLEGMSLDSEQVKASKLDYRAKLVFVGMPEDFDYYAVAYPYIPAGPAKTVKSQKIPLESFKFGNLKLKKTNAQISAVLQFDINKAEDGENDAVEGVKCTVTVDMPPEMLADTILAIACELDSPGIDLKMVVDNSVEDDEPVIPFIEGDNSDACDDWNV